MSSKERNRFYLFWTLAIVLCFMLAMFTLFFASCSKDVKSINTDPSGEPAAAVWVEADRI